MISLFGTTLSAAWPWLLVGVPLVAGLLVYIFRSRGASNPFVASTLFLIKRLPEYEASRKDASFPPLFWLELLAFSALVAAASGLFISQSGERIAVVIDTSKSMSAAIAGGETRLDLARRLASSDIAQGSDQGRYSVFSATDTLTAVRAAAGASGYLLSSGAREAVEGVSASYLQDSLQPLVSKLARSSEYDRIWVYTDQVLEGEAVSERVKIVSVREQGELAGNNNLWLASLKQASGDRLDGGSGDRIEGVISSTGRGELGVSVVASCGVGEGLKIATLPGIKQRMTLGSDLNFELGSMPSDWRYCKVELSTERADNLALDNTAWITRSAGSERVNLVGSLSVGELGLERINFTEIVSAKNPWEAGAIGAIFHRITPSPGAPKGSVLVVNPPADAGNMSEFAALTGAAPVGAGGVEITRWDEAHPTLRYLQPQLISPPRASNLSCGDWSKPILFSSAGAIACAGERDGKRFAVVGFELFPFDGAKSAGVSILTLNLIKWVFDPSLRAGTEGARVGAIALPYQALSAKLILPEERLISDNLARSILVTTPGVVQIEREQEAKRASDLIAVNSFSTRESDLTKRVTLKLDSELAQIGLNPGQAGQMAGGEDRDRRDLTVLLTVAFLLVLAIDPVWRLVRRARARGGS